MVVSSIPYMCMCPDMELRVQWAHKSIKVIYTVRQRQRFFVCLLFFLVAMNGLHGNEQTDVQCPTRLD